MAGRLVLAVVAVWCVSWEVRAEEVDGATTEGGGEVEVETPAILVGLVADKGFNISIPEAGKEMTEFKYYVTFNQEWKDVTKELFCKGRVECFSDKSRFRMEKAKELKEGDTLHFYLVGFRKAGGFQMERVYEVKKGEDGTLQFEEKSARAGLQADGIWYHLDNTVETWSN